MTTWIPKANPKSYLPKVCLTLTLHHSKLQIYAENTEELVSIVEQIHAEVLRLKPQLEKAHKKEVEDYLMWQKAIDNALGT